MLAAGGRRLAHRPGILLSGRGQAGGDSRTTGRALRARRRKSQANSVARLHTSGCAVSGRVGPRGRTRSLSTEAAAHWEGDGDSVDLQLPHLLLPVFSVLLNLLGRHWLVQLHGFPVRDCRIHPLCVAWCAHRPKSASVAIHLTLFPPSLPDPFPLACGPCLRMRFFSRLLLSIYIPHASEIGGLDLLHLIVLAQHACFVFCFHNVW